AQNRQGKTATSKDVHICLDDFSDQGPLESAGGSTANSASLFLPSTISNLMGHKRSFAVESATGANMKSANNVSGLHANRPFDRMQIAQVFCILMLRQVHCLGGN